MTPLNDRLEAVRRQRSNDPLTYFPNFLWMVWNHLNLPEPTPVQYDVSKFLQYGPRRAIIMAFRGFGKSWITAAFVCWLLYMLPQLKILVISASKVRADDFSTFVLRLINEVPVLQHLKPKDDGRSSKIAFDVGPAIPDQSPSVKSIGITGQIAGSRADVIIADDVEIPTNSATQSQRDKLAEAVKEFDAVLKPGGKVVYLGTPQTELSLYNTLQKRGYVVRIWPVRYPKAERRDRYGIKLAPIVANALDEDPSLAGKPADRFSEEDLRERELSYGKQGFALQFMLDTSLSDLERYPLKLADLIVHPLDQRMAPVDFMWASAEALEVEAVGLEGDRYYKPGWVSQHAAAYEDCVMWVDPSGRGKDETAYAVVKSLHGRLFLSACGGYLDGYEDKTLRAILHVAKQHGVKTILCEPNYGGGMFTKLLSAKARDVYPTVNVEDGKWSAAQKEKRIIDTLEPVMMAHRLVVCPSVVNLDYNSVLDREDDKAIEYRLFHQMTRITAESGALAHDDRLEALAGAVSYFLEGMERSTNEAAQSHEEGLLEDSLREFMEEHDKLFGGLSHRHDDHGLNARGWRG